MMILTNTTWLIDITPINDVLSFSPLLFVPVSAICRDSAMVKAKAMTMTDVTRKIRSLNFEIQNAQRMQQTVRNTNTSKHGKARRATRGTFSSGVWTGIKGGVKRKIQLLIIVTVPYRSTEVVGDACSSWKDKHRNCKLVNGRKKWTTHGMNMNTPMLRYQTALHWHSLLSRKLFVSLEMQQELQTWSAFEMNNSLFGYQHDVSIFKLFAAGIAY
jgi:hypothetical protein